MDKGILADILAGIIRGDEVALSEITERLGQRGVRLSFDTRWALLRREDFLRGRLDALKEVRGKICDG